MKGKYIIALSGVSDTGKTATLQKVIKRLGLTIQSGRPKDWIAYGDYRGIKMCVGCRADAPEYVDENIEIGIRVNASIIITGIRSGRKVVERVRIKYESYTTIAIDKYKESVLPDESYDNYIVTDILEPTRDDINEHYVEDIIALIDRLIDLG